jgi:oligoendopeptidase F
VGLLERFSPDTDWEGLEPVREMSWQRVGHLFDTPFYMLEYSMAQLGALQVWRNYLEDPAGAVARLRHAFSLGNTRPLPQLYEAAGIRFDFSAETLGELLAFAEERYEELLAD